MAEKIRFGGKVVEGEFRFEMTGGHLALDFVNTLDQREGEPRELLTDYDRLLSWTRQVASLPLESIELLEACSRRKPAVAERALKDVKVAREVIFSLVRTVSRSQPVEQSSLTRMNVLAGDADRARTFCAEGRRLSWTYAKFDDLRMPLWPIVHAAMDLLLSEQNVRRLKLCEGDTCNWAFLDTSRQARRRWCDMSVCGNRAKVRRHRNKNRKPHE